jgi:hypothetical protein
MADGGEHDGLPRPPRLRRTTEVRIAPDGTVTFTTLWEEVTPLARALDPDFRDAPRIGAEDGR